ncbi:pseudaminic acid synthase [Desulfovibrio mangrovi]|uniref:pseudaminic acid synthase n=1 Tax=Desulfovibrio mangrovi TaxID=2976983 RepID=UPI0022455B10|nr:pseudaminic acid synthase [Desulfovibrio mangrovi]UZP66800.1 pseudaminic acid synthase [Desulfovibrio mangrovi]
MSTPATGNSPLRTCIIAEVSANHKGSVERAEAIIRAAAEAGADAVKLQTYTADTMTIPCDNEYFRIKGTLWDGRTLHDLYQEAHTPWEWTPRLMACAKDLGMDCFSTPFDATAVDFLEKYGVSRHKIASFEAVDIPLLKKVAGTGKPVILSTGMASLAEIDEAVRTLRENGTTDLTLLKCTSAYPAPANEANLLTIPHMAEAFGCPVGLSDHTLGSAVAVAAVALGATVIEKHFTLARADGGPDAAFSMEPYELKQLVHDVRTVEQAIGRVSYELTEKQQESTVFRRSLFVVKDMKAGEVFTPDNVRSIRPGYGMPPRYLDQILGKAATSAIKAGTPMSWGLV